jgi:hypothetical protein
MTLFNENSQMKGLVGELNSEIAALKTNIKEEKDRDNTRHEITSYVESMELDRKRLESELESLTERMTEYRGLYEKSVKSLMKKGSDDKTTETIIFNNFINFKTFNSVFLVSNIIVVTKVIDTNYLMIF